MILGIIISIASIIALFAFLRWVGWKGFISMLLGMAIVAWLFLSKNLLVLWVVKKASGEDFIDEMMGTEDLGDNELSKLKHSENSNKKLEKKVEVAEERE